MTKHRSSWGKYWKFWVKITSHKSNKVIIWEFCYVDLTVLRNCIRIPTTAICLFENKQVIKYLLVCFIFYYWNLPTIEYESELSSALDWNEVGASRFFAVIASRRRWILVIEMRRKIYFFKPIVRRRKKNEQIINV